LLLLYSHQQHTLYNIVVPDSYHGEVMDNKAIIFIFYRIA
jgi:hypothetical protein